MGVSSYGRPPPTWKIPKSKGLAYIVRVAIPDEGGGFVRLRFRWIWCFFSGSGVFYFRSSWSSTSEIRGGDSHCLVAFGFDGLLVVVCFDSCC
ncbi:hypothetical protein P8452_10299 [Trifolium repens]|nr:hypothetical protein P8452_10299 [Trifolium repens]